MPNYERAGVCKHCGRSIMLFEFATGMEWWHMASGDNNQTTRRCHAGNTYAEPTD